MMGSPVRGSQISNLRSQNKTSRDIWNRGWLGLKTGCAMSSAPGCRTSPGRPSTKEEAVSKGEVKECSGANHGVSASLEARTQL
jgi:hypothetical protein